MRAPVVVECACVWDEHGAGARGAHEGHGGAGRRASGALARRVPHEHGQVDDGRRELVRARRVACPARLERARDVVAQRLAAGPQRRQRVRRRRVVGGHHRGQRLVARAQLGLRHRPRAPPRAPVHTRLLVPRDFGRFSWRPRCGASHSLESLIFTLNRTAAAFWVLRVGDGQRVRFVARVRRVEGVCRWMKKKCDSAW